MRFQTFIDWALIIVVFSFTLANLIWTTNVVSLKIWMGIVLYNFILSHIFKMKFQQLAHDAIELAKITNELLKREKRK